MKLSAETLLEQILERYVQDNQFSGAVLVRKGNADLLWQARGLAHRGFCVPNTVNTRFDTASLGKVWTAVAAFRLADKGILALDDRVTELAGLTGTNIPPEVTIAQCLSHSSGIADDADEEAGEDYEAIWQAKPCYLVRETSDLLENFVHKAPLFKAGSASRYNNAGYILVGLAMEKRTGLPFRTIVEREVIQPLGLRDTGYFAKDGIDGNVAEGYATITDSNGSTVGFRKNIFSYPPVGSPDAGICTSVRDLSKLFDGIQSDKFIGTPLNGRLLSPVIDAFTLKSGDIRRYGHSLEFDYSASGTLRRYGKDGVNPGVATIAMYYPATDGFVAILSNQDSDVWSMCRELAAAAHLG